MLKLRRAQDLISQKKRKSVSLETVFEELVDHFLEKNDPMRRAKRQMLKGKLSRDLKAESSTVKFAEVVSTSNTLNSTHATKVLDSSELSELSELSESSVLSELVFLQVVRPVKSANNIRVAQTFTASKTQSNGKAEYNKYSNSQIKRKPLPASI